MHKQGTEGNAIYKLAFYSNIGIISIFIDMIRIMNGVGEISVWVRTVCAAHAFCDRQRREGIVTKSAGIYIPHCPAMDMRN